MRADCPQFIPIAAIADETPNVKTYFFDYPLKSKPGQFVMLWILGLDQKPFSIGYDNGQQFGLTIFALGKSTQELAGKKVGDRVGITGPYGTSFSVKPQTHYIMVGGGYGAAPLGFLAEEILNCHPNLSAMSSRPNGRSERSLSVGKLDRDSSVASLPQNDNVIIDYCVGARTAQDILFEERIKKLPSTAVRTATDDGSHGHHGYVTDVLEQLLRVNPRNQSASNPLLVVTCGPELMEKKVLDICNQFGVECEISVERYMKCGFGVCGQCCVDPLGLRMCTEGPVVNRATANQITEFGQYHCDKSGAKINF